MRMDLPSTFGEDVGARLFVEAVLAAGLFAGLRLGDADVVVIRRGGELAREEVVAGEAVGDVLDVAGAGGAFDFLEKYDFHGGLLQTKWATRRMVAGCPLWVITGCWFL